MTSRKLFDIPRVVLAGLLIACSPGESPPNDTVRAGSDDFASFVDQYLDAFARRHPSIAAGNGLHQHDDRLEDFSAAAIADEIAYLKATKARLRAMDVSRLTPDERVDHRIIDGLLDAWLLEQETIANWRRNPMIYASAISDGVHNLMTMDADPAELRMSRVTAKLRHVPRLLDAARTNIVNPPAVFAQRGLNMMRGASGMLKTDLALAFAAAGNDSVRREMLVVADSARTAIDGYVAYLERDVLPTATGDFATGTAYVRARYAAEELIDVPLDTLVAIGMRELAREQAEFTAIARMIDSTREAMAVWRDVLANHPGRGELVSVTQRTVDELTAFVKAKRLVDLPNEEKVVVAPSKPFDIGLASMHASPPLESRPVPSMYYVTDANPAWPAARQDAWLQKFNYATLAIISAHEAMPGHFVHSLFMRDTPGKVRRIWIGLNPFPQPSSGQDGWAHYAEQLMIEQGYKSDDPRYRLAQLSESMTRICRLISGIKLHTNAWTLDQSATFFETEAHLPSPAARSEAERNTYDPTNGGYFLGKRALMKLRADVQEKQGTAFDLRAFHERVMRNGIAPWWAHRQLMLPGDTSLVVN